MPNTGDVGLVRVKPNGLRWFIRLGQWLTGDGFADYEHAVVCEAYSHPAEVALVIQAEPGGATRGLYMDEDRVLWTSFGIPLDDHQRQAIADAARGYRGTPYSFLDYLAIALHSWHVPFPGLKRYVASTKHMICSQLADQCYQDAGIYLFNDERWPGYVSPADLYDLSVGRES